jgi:hypothetical protein
VAKKAQQEEVVESPDSFTDRIFDQVEKDYGEGVLVSGTDALNESPAHPVDADARHHPVRRHRGGVVGRHHRPPEDGKTTAALCVRGQRPAAGVRGPAHVLREGRGAALPDPPPRASRGWTCGKGRFNIIQSREGKILTSQDFLRILDNVIKTVPGRSSSSTPSRPCATRRS